MDIFLVGGAVRDKLLDLPYSERDWLVLGATRQEMLEAGYLPVESGFPVFLHPETGEEYALARRETKTGPGYKGFDVYTGPDVTLEQDLARRDLTINAMALDKDGRVLDPCHGQEDLADGLLRHVSEAFVEDPVRLLRIARFAAKLGRWGFRVAHGTYGLMKKMARSRDLKQLRPERLWREMKKALQEAQPWQFFQVLQRCGALDVLLPRLAVSMDGSAAHDDRSDSAPMQALKLAVEQEAGSVVGFAVVMVYAVANAQEASELADRLCLEKEYRELLLQLAAARDIYSKPDSVSAGELLDFTNRTAGNAPTQYTRLMLACSICWPDVAEEAQRKVEIAGNAVQSVSTRELMAQGFQGGELGLELRLRRLAAIEAELAGFGRG